MEVLIKTYYKITSNDCCSGRTMTVCVLSSGGGHNDCLCVYNSLQTASIFITKNKDDVFCPPSECLFPFFHPLCLFFSCQSELSPHETGKIRPKSTSCLLSVIMRGWVQSAQASSAPCPQCHHTQTLLCQVCQFKLGSGRKRGL